MVGALLGEESSQEAAVLMCVFSCGEMCWHRAVVGQLGDRLWPLWVSFCNCACQLERRFLAGFPLGPTLGCTLPGGRVSETECPLPAQLEEDGGERC